jgi:hypothetical protein
MTKDIRSPNVEESSGVQWPVRHSDFDIPSDFVIRHSDLRIEVHGKSPFKGSASTRAPHRFLRLDDRWNQDSQREPNALARRIVQPPMPAKNLLEKDSALRWNLHG